jgi:predicted ATPase
LIDEIAISGYRSLRSIILKLGGLTVITGENGSGKTNMYRALKLVAETANGKLAESLAKEGGFHSAIWAGPKLKSNDSLGIKLGLRSEDFCYCIDLGFPSPTRSAFNLDPEVKRECLWVGSKMESKSLCADRTNSKLRSRASNGNWIDVELFMSRHTSMLFEYSDPLNAPELIVARQELSTWRFYDTFRVDSDAPSRRSSLATFTPVMSGDGSDLAAAIQTIIELGNYVELEQAVESAFPGSKVRVQGTDSGLALAIEQPGVLRPLIAAEISDGTLRFFLLIASLLTPRPPKLMVLNEPENSLHPSLIPALANLIRLASKKSQVIVVSHNTLLIDELEQDRNCVSIQLEKKNGATVVTGEDLMTQYGWKWPKR